MPIGNFPVNLNPTTLGINIDTGWPSKAASASIPPTPQPSTPKPLTMVVCESVPTTVSGYARKTPETSLVITTLAKNSIFTW